MKVTSHSRIYTLLVCNYFTVDAVYGPLGLFFKAMKETGIIHLVLDINFECL